MLVATIKTYDPYEQQLKCAICKKTVLKQENGILIPFSSKLQEAYNALELYRLKKTKKKDLFQYSN